MIKFGQKKFDLKCRIIVGFTRPKQNASIERFNKAYGDDVHDDHVLDSKTSAHPVK
ncbi:MAG TPA: hypothetical protein VK772_15155 [Puia sp.]|jgi:hypothetical protein|nr:hypothetical protein [Puia sp.]